MAHNCRTELPPMELKIIDGKVISSPRRPGPRVKFSIDESAPHRTQNSRPQSNDGNGNHRGDQGLYLNECDFIIWQALHWFNGTGNEQSLCDRKCKDIWYLSLWQVTIIRIFLGIILLTMFCYTADNNEKWSNYAECKKL